MLRCEKSGEDGSASAELHWMRCESSLAAD